MDLSKLSNALIAEGILNSPLQLIRSIGGGCINDCFQLQSGSKFFFLKKNNASAYPGMFVAEAAGLHLLRRSSAITIPRVLYHTEIDGDAYLLMEFIHSGRQQADFWEQFGRGLAELHQNRAVAFGLESSNYIGSLDQKNDKQDNWAVFFLECRLIPQLQMGISSGWAERASFRRAEQLCRMIDDEFPKEPPSLVHGDLWSGNYLCGENGQPVLVDPAVYYGNREIDLAFSKMFGGFDSSFYDHYQQTLALAEDFEKRIEIHNLYPLLVHANLFGGHYVEQTLRLLSRFN